MPARSRYFRNYTGNTEATPVGTKNVLYATDSQGDNQYYITTADNFTEINDVIYIGGFSIALARVDNYYAPMFIVIKINAAKPPNLFVGIRGQS